MVFAGKRDRRAHKVAAIERSGQVLVAATIDGIAADEELRAGRSQLRDCVVVDGERCARVQRG